MRRNRQCLACNEGVGSYTFLILTCRLDLKVIYDQGYGRRGTPIFTGVFEPLARVAMYPTDEDGLGTWFAAA